MSRRERIPFGLIPEANDDGIHQLELEPQHRRQPPLTTWYYDLDASRITSLSSPLLVLYTTSHSTYGHQDPQASGLTPFGTCCTSPSSTVNWHLRSSNPRFPPSPHCERPSTMRCVVSVLHLVPHVRRVHRLFYTSGRTTPSKMHIWFSRFRSASRVKSHVIREPVTPYVIGCQDAT